MTTLQYFMLEISLVAIIVSPHMLAKAIRRRQNQRVLDCLLSDFMVLYLAVDVIWPSAIAFAPRPVRLMIVVLGVVWIANFFGAFRRLFDRQKASPIERR